MDKLVSLGLKNVSNASTEHCSLRLRLAGE